MNAPALLDMPRRLLLRIEDFLILNDTGVLDGFSKSELIDGEIITVNSQFQRHSYAKNELAFCLRGALDKASSLIVLCEVSVAMPPHDMPEPDIVVMRGPIGVGAVALDKIILLVEVADTTRDFDLGRKAALYAHHRIPEYWVVDLPSAEIVRHWQPGADGFARRDAVAFGTPITATTLPDLTIETAGLG